MPTTFHVSPEGDDAHEGSADRPVRTISAAAARAVAGDTVLVHAGVYRERVDPPRGGTSPSDLITYTAAPGEHAVLTGSDVLTGWSTHAGDIWRLQVPSSYFGDFNPYAELVHGDWFDAMGREHRRGNVFVDGAWLPEVPTVQALQAGEGLGWTASVEGAASGDGVTTIYARFPHGIEPNGGRVEISVRPTVFTPTAEHVDYIALRGFEIRNAATNWVAPTAGQQGMVTAYWSRGWVIEDNEICYSRCAGIALAKNHDEFDGTRGTTEGFYLTIEDALERDGWSRETIGSHTVRNNRIHHCGQVGIVGALGCAFSTIEDNEIYDCNLQGAWSGAEQAGIKLHGAIDVVIRGNHVYRCGEPAAIWLDWMGQGTQVIGNLMHDNMRDIFAEVNHGPILIADNIMLSRTALLWLSRGAVLAHNLVVGRIEVMHDDRETPYLRPHSTEPVAMRRICTVGDTHWVNNIISSAVDFAGFDQAEAQLPCTFADNVQLGPEHTSPVQPVAATAVERIDDSWWLSISAPIEWEGRGEQVTTDTLGAAVIPEQHFTAPDGSGMVLDRDYLGRRRPARVAPGPFARTPVGAVQVWPRT